MVELPLKWTCIPYLPHTCLMLSPIPFVYGITTWPTVFLLALTLLFCLLPGLLFCVVLVLLSIVCVVVSWPLLLLLLDFAWGLLSSWLLFRTLFLTLLIAQLGELHLPRALLKWSISLWSKSGSVQTTLAPWVSVPMTLYLAERPWWLSHCKYWSVWMGIWYTLKDSDLSAKGVTRVSRNGIAPLSWFPSTVNLIARSMLLIWSRNACLCACFWMTHVSSTNLYHALGGE